MEIYLAVISVILIGATIILGVFAWLLTLMHASSKNSYKVALLIGFIPILGIFYQICFWKETKKAQYITLLTILFSIITYIEFQAMINAFEEVS